MKCLGYIFALTIYWFIIHSFADEAGIISNEAKLREELMVKRKIDIHTRPKQLEGSKSTNVMIGMYIMDIISLDEKTEIFSTNAWILNNWNDSNLIWNPENFGGLDYLNLELNNIWTPEIYLINSANASFSSSTGVSEVWLYSSGIIYWWTAHTLHSICPLDLKAFPFDEHTCSFHLTSTLDLGNELNLTLFDVSNPSYQFAFNHKEWNITSAHCNRTLNLYFDEEYQIVYLAILNFYITFERRMPYYYLALISPTIIAVLITLLTFWTPPSSDQKLLMSGVNVAILLVFIMNLFWIVPRSGSSVPGIVIFCGNAAFFAGLTFLLSIATVAIYNNPPNYPPPTWMTNLLSVWLTSILCLSYETSIKNNSKLLNDDDNYENKPTELSDPHSKWQFIACILDRVGFVLYSVILSIVLIVAFA